MNAATAGGNATSPRIDVTIMFHVKIGMRHIVIPGARIRNVVVTMLTPVSRVGDGDEREAQDPQIRSDTRGHPGLGQRRICVPAHRRPAAGRREPRQQNEHAAADEEPVRERVQPREGHVGRADLQAGRGSCPRPEPNGATNRKIITVPWIVNSPL